LNEFLELFDYNAWANGTIFDAVARLPEEQYFRDLKSSYGGIHGTLCHIAWAEQLWLHRWQGKPNPAVPQGTDLKSLADVRKRWETVEAERGAFVAGLTDAVASVLGEQARSGTSVELVATPEGRSGLGGTIAG